MMQRNRGVIDPPPGGAFRDPVEIVSTRPEPGLLDVALEPRWTRSHIDAVPANLLTYNGYFASPTIRVRTSDRLRVRFRNGLPTTGARNALGHEVDATNLHTHGLHVSPSGNADNSMVVHAPGKEFVYEYDLSKQPAGTLNYYHPHVHGTVAAQVWAGLGGALVVEDDSDALAGIEEHLLVLKDISLQGLYPEPHSGPMDYLHGKLGDRVLVNGQANPVLTIRPGQIQRWRVLNASTARFYRLALEGHVFQLVGTDGGLLDKPYPLREILLSPGERVDVLVQADQPAGTYRLRSLPYGGGCHSSAQTVTLLTLPYDSRAERQELPKAVNPRAARLQLDPGALQHRRIVLSMGMGRGYINGISFGEGSTFTVSSRVGTYEIWEIVNSSCMDHPFHQHVNAAQVLSITGGDPTYATFHATAPAWKDTVIIPAWGSATLLMPVQDFTGMAMFHCHILEHEDIGMMGMWEIA